MTSEYINQKCTLCTGMGYVGSAPLAPCVSCNGIGLEPVALAKCEGCQKPRHLHCMAIRRIIPNHNYEPVVDMLCHNWAQKDVKGVVYAYCESCARHLGQESRPS